MESRSKSPKHGTTRKALAHVNGASEESALRGTRYGYGGDAEVLRSVPAGQPHFGSLIATYERADVKTSAQGLSVYADEGASEIILPLAGNGRANLIDEFCDAVLTGTRPLHSGQFAKGTVEACLAIHDSARERREILLRPQENH